jgi:hypothetical protein
MPVITGGTTQQGTQDPFGFDPEGWRKSYYNDYAGKIAKVGGTPVDPTTFFNTYGIGNNASGKMFEEARLKYEKSITQTGIDQYNQKAKEISDATGQPPQTWQGATDNIDEISQGLNQLTSTADFYAKPENAEKLNQPTYDQTPEYKQIMETLNKMTEGGAPKFTPDMVTQWQGTVNEMAKPFEQEGLNQMRANQSLQSSLGGRSSIMDKQVNDLMGKYQAQKLQTALGLGQDQYNSQLEQFMNALSQKASMSQVGSQQANAGYMANINNLWQNQNQNAQNQYSDAQWQKQAGLATSLAELSKANQPQWYDYLAQGLGSSVGMLGGSALTGGIGSLLGLGKKAVQGVA